MCPPFPCSIVSTPYKNIKYWRGALTWVRNWWLLLCGKKKNRGEWSESSGSSFMVDAFLFSQPWTPSWSLVFTEPDHTFASALSFIGMCYWNMFFRNYIFIHFTLYYISPHTYPQPLTSRHPWFHILQNTQFISEANGVRKNNGNNKITK